MLLDHLFDEGSDIFSYEIVDAEAAESMGLDTVNLPGSTKVVDPYEASRMRKTIDRQMVIIEAIWLLLKKDGHTEEEFRELVAAVETERSKTKGLKAPVERPKCPNCGIPLQRTDSVYNRCLYCGHEIIGSPFDLAK